MSVEAVSSHYISTGLRRGTSASAKIFRRRFRSPLAACRVVVGWLPRRFTFGSLKKETMGIVGDGLLNDLDLDDNLRQEI